MGGALGRAFVRSLKKAKIKDFDHDQTLRRDLSFAEGRNVAQRKKGRNAPYVSLPVTDTLNSLDPTYFLLIQPTSYPALQTYEG